MSNFLKQIYNQIYDRFVNSKYDLLVLDAEKFCKKFSLDKCRNHTSNIFEEVATQQDYYVSIFVFDKNNVDEYAYNFMLYKWLIDHHDKRANDFVYVLKPKNLQIDLSNVSRNDIIFFVSPQTQISTQKVL